MLSSCQHVADTTLDKPQKASCRINLSVKNWDKSRTTTAYRRQVRRRFQCSSMSCPTKLALVELAHLNGLIRSFSQGSSMFPANPLGAEGVRFGSGTRCHSTTQHDKRHATDSRSSRVTFFTIENKKTRGEPCQLLCVT
jgi:hypothetical protein